jgi:hypothetical protein
MLQIKIHGETPKSGKSLCRTCKHATLVKGQNCQEVIFCSGPFSGDAGMGPVPFKIASCGSYHPVNMPYLHEMQDIAWEVKARRRGPVGFEPDLRPLEITITPPKSRNGDSDD